MPRLSQKAFISPHLPPSPTEQKELEEFPLLSLASPSKVQLSLIRTHTHWSDGRRRAACFCFTFTTAMFYEEQHEESALIREKGEREREREREREESLLLLFLPLLLLGGGIYLRLRSSFVARARLLSSSSSTTTEMSLQPSHPQKSVVVVVRRRRRGDLWRINDGRDKTAAAPQQEPPKKCDDDDHRIEKGERREATAAVLCKVVNHCVSFPPSLMRVCVLSNSFCVSKEEHIPVKTNNAQLQATKKMLPTNLKSLSAGTLPSPLYMSLKIIAMSQRPTNTHCSLLLKYRGS